MVLLVPKFGYTLGMELGMAVWFSVINHTILTNSLYSFWVWYDEWVIFLEKILLSLKIVIHDHYQSHTCDTCWNKILFYRPIIVQWKLVACENSYNNWGWFEYLYSWSIVLNFRNHFFASSWHFSQYMAKRLAELSYFLFWSDWPVQSLNPSFTICTMLSDKT